MKKFLLYFSLGVMLLGGLMAARAMGRQPLTYDPEKVTVPVYELQQNPESYDDSTADGAAAAIVQQNLATTHAVNDVTSIVFDFRGYDTMGEAFILMLTVTAAIVLLRKTREEKKRDQEARDGKQQ